MNMNFGPPHIEFHPNRKSTFPEFISTINRIPLHAVNLRGMCMCFISDRNLKPNESAMVNAMCNLLIEFSPSDLVIMEINDNDVDVIEVEEA